MPEAIGNRAMQLRLGSSLPTLQRPPWLLIVMLIALGSVLSTQLQAQTARVRGANEGMKPGEKTDD